MFKKALFSVIILFFISGLLHAQNFNWITPNRTYLKLYVVNEGMTRINRLDFLNSGINTSSIDPRTVKVLNKGVEVPIYFSGEQDGVFNDGDYLDFYGNRNSGGLTNTYNQNNIVVYTTNEYYNQYSDTNAYWIDWGGANGMRFSNSNFTTSNLYPSDFYFQTLHFEKDKMYYQGENVSGQDTRYLNTEKFRGEGWYWNLLSTNQSVSDTFSIPALYASPRNATLRIFAYPQNGSTSITNEHSLEIYANGSLITTIYSNNTTDFDLKRIDTTITFSSSFLSATSVNNISIKYVAASGFPGLMFIDLFELSYPRSFKIVDKKISADLLSTDTTSKFFKISGYNPSNTINIYDVRNNFRISNFTVTSDTLKFTAKNNAKLEIVNDTIRNKPSKIIQRQVPNLVSNSNGADYLLVYHADFLAQAEQLREYRQTSDNYRSIKADIKDIYDIFNYGNEDPIALKYFVKHVYDTWPTPKLRYVCLFGRGSLDPKKNSAGTNFEKNYIPVYGNPPTDGYYSNFNVGTFFYYDMVSIGRLPAYYVSEAQTMVDKIIAYENEPPDRWWKTFTYITGGATPNEQNSYQQRSNFEIAQYITQCPIAGEAVKIYRTDTSGSGTFNYADSIKNTVNRGTLYVNFRGHAGSHDWEVGMSDPNILSNGNKLPLVLSLTCFTGENSKSEFRGFGEKWMYLPGKGAIGFVSTTGWSFESAGNDFGTYIIQTIKLDSTRKLGELTKSAGKSMSADSLSFSIRHTVNCYKLLGDPAVKLKLPKYPEFAIKDTDYKLSTESVVLNEPITLKITPKDYGLCADTCLIRFQLKKNGVNYLTKDTAYRNFKFFDTVLYNFKIDSPGVYKMLVVLDQNNRYPLELESNNSITINIPYNEYAYLPIKPVNSSISYNDSIELSGLNPRLDFTQNTVKVMLQLDTSKLFNSPVLQTFVNSNISGADTKFRTLLPVLANNTIYYWRTNSVINNDSTGWTKTSNFIYNNGQVSDEEQDRFIYSNVDVDLLKNNVNQYSESDFNNTGFVSGGIGLVEYTSNMFVRSLGSNGEEASYFSVGNRNIYIDGGQNAGINMIKVKKLNGNILEFKNLKMTAQASSDSLVNFLNTFDSTHYLMLLNAAYVPGGTTLSGNAKAKLRQFGSVYCDSIGLLGYFHTWSLIGSLGADTNHVSEMFDPCCRTSPNCTACDHWTQSTSSMSVLFKRTSGSVTNIIGPAKAWTDFYWNPSVPLNSSLVFDIIGIDYSGNKTVLRQNVETHKFVELSTIDALLYPYLNLLAKFSIDTLTGDDSPVLNSLNVSYSPGAELVLDKNSLQINSLTKDNNITNFSFNYHNSGFAYLNGTIVNLYAGSIADPNLIFTDTVSSILKIDSTRSYSNAFTTPVFRDSTRIIINIKPKDFSNEFYSFNNSADFKLTGSGSSIASAQIEVTGDGKVINNGDFMSRNPEIRINLTKPDAPFVLSDTTLLSVRLNGNYVPYFVSGKMNPVIKTIQSDNNTGNNVSLIYFPSLENGKNKLSVVYKGDSNDNMDTVSYDVIVSDELLVNDLYNYPNPMKNETNFIFNLAGAVSQYQFKLKIYTVSGKLIKEIDYNANVGNNMIPWDGRDNDGDIVANGTYFYKLIVAEETNSELKVQKLVVLK